MHRPARAEVCSGSFTSFSRCPLYVRSSPESGRIADIAGRLKSARTRLMHRTNSPQEVSRITWKCRLTTGRKTGTIHPFSVFVSTRSSLTPDMA